MDRHPFIWPLSADMMRRPSMTGGASVYTPIGWEQRPLHSEIQTIETAS